MSQTISPERKFFTSHAAAGVPVLGTTQSITVDGTDKHVHLKGGHYLLVNAGTKGAFWCAAEAAATPLATTAGNQVPIQAGQAVEFTVPLDSVDFEFHATQNTEAGAVLYLSLWE